MFRNCRFWILLIFILFAYNSKVMAETKQVRVAFTRNHDLWIKEGKEEKQLTNGEYVTNPKWSYDARWIAYAKGREENEIWLYDTVHKKHLHPVLSEAANYQWSPHKNVLAFQFGGVLNTIDLRKKEKKFKNVAFGVGNYSWLPDGKGFLVSSDAHLLPSGWTSVELFKVPVDADINAEKVKYFYTLPNQSDSFFAVSTSKFKWSPDKKWISFLGIPTASWSMDSDTLCVLLVYGKNLKQSTK